MSTVNEKEGMLSQIYLDGKSFELTDTDCKSRILVSEFCIFIEEKQPFE